jgi:Skp family chaperone for outer membrane proteins
MSGLEKQLGGMGVAFASSLLGLAGSLVVGLLELFAGHGQNRFYRELEEWLSSITRLGFATGDEGPASEAGALAALMDHMAEQMDSLQQMFAQSENSRSAVDKQLGDLTGAVDSLVRKLDAGNPTADALTRMADNQEKLVAHFETYGTADGLDAESRMRLRSIDVQMLRILEEISAGRQESMAALRSDLSALTQALRGESATVRRLHVKSGPES